MICRVFALLVLYSSTTCWANGRQRRVVSGIPIPDRIAPGYSVIRYFVWIGFDRDFLTELRWEAQRQVCGGALLTTTVIQSACHCFCDTEMPPRGSSFMRAVRNEHSMRAVVGHSTVNPLIRPMKINWYIIHPHCGKAQDGWLINDFALLVLADEVKLDALTVKLAPVYPLEEVAEMWRRVSVRQTVCLVVGFGRYISKEINIKPDVLLHSWYRLLSIMDCLKLYCSRQGASDNVTKVLATMTKSCLKPLVSHMTSSKGDSGSPITCDEFYFGVNSQSLRQSLLLIDDVVYYAYANSLEYRPQMVRECQYWAIRPPPKGLKNHTIPPDYLISPNPTPAFLAISSSASIRNNFDFSSHLAVLAILSSDLV